MGRCCIAKPEKDGLLLPRPRYHSGAKPQAFSCAFFAVPQERMQQDPHADGELLDLRWVEARNPQRLPIIDVTEFMLNELQRELDGKRADLPLLSYVNEVMRIRRLSISP